jgi:hypothetical protein
VSRLRAPLAIAALALCGWVLPPDRVLGEIERHRQKSPPLRIAAALEAADAPADWPATFQMELHPRRGARLRAEDGRRWIVQGGRVTQRGASTGSSWIPQPELLALSRREDLENWLSAAGIDPGANQLARCGESDCYVLGGRDRPVQLWVDKDRFEVWRFRSADGRGVQYESFKEWDGVRFPERIVIDAGGRPLATIHVREVTVARDLDRADFSLSWIGQE